MRVASWIVGDMRKEGLLSGAIIIVGKRIDWGIWNEVAMRVAKRLCTSSRILWDAVVVWMVGSCQRVVRVLDVIWSSKKDMPWNLMLEE